MLLEVPGSEGVRTFAAAVIRSASPAFGNPQVVFEFSAAVEAVSGVPPRESQIDARRPFADQQRLRSAVGDVDEFRF